MDQPHVERVPRLRGGQKAQREAAPLPCSPGTLARSVFLVFSRWGEFSPTWNWHRSDAAELRRGQKRQRNHAKRFGAVLARGNGITSRMIYLFTCSGQWRRLRQTDQHDAGIASASLVGDLELVTALGFEAAEPAELPGDRARF